MPSLTPESLQIMETLDGYIRGFTDPSLWAPYIQEVCRRHSLKWNGIIRSSLPGTYPAFIAGERWLVKFFGRLFDGVRDYQAELKAAHLLALDPAIPLPELIASGHLFEAGTGWSWPYLVFEYLPGASLGAAWETLEFQERLRIAEYMGEVTRRLHTLPLQDWMEKKALKGAFFSVSERFVYFVKFPLSFLSFFCNNVINHK